MTKKTKMFTTINTTLRVLKFERSGTREQRCSDRFSFLSRSGWRISRFSTWNSDFSSTTAYLPPPQQKNKGIRSNSNSLRVNSRAHFYFLVITCHHGVGSGGNLVDIVPTDLPDLSKPSKTSKGEPKFRDQNIEQNPKTSTTIIFLA